MHTTKQNLYDGKGSLKLIWTLLVAIACIGTLALVSCPDDPDDDKKLVITSSETADLKWGDTVTYTLTEDGEPVTTDIEWSVFRDSVAAAEVSGVTKSGNTLDLDGLITQENGELTIDYRFFPDVEVTGTIPYVIAAVYGAKTVTYTTSLKSIYMDITMVAKDAKSFTLDLSPVPFVNLATIIPEVTNSGVRFGLSSTSLTNLIFLNNNNGTDGANQTTLNPDFNLQSEDGTLSATVEGTFLDDPPLDTDALLRVKISNTNGNDLTDPVGVEFLVYERDGYEFTREIKVEFHLSAISIGQSASFAMGSDVEVKTAVFNADTSGYVIAP